MKKKALVLGVLLSLMLSSCQGLFTPTPPTGPTVDSAATSDAVFKTAIAETLTARPTLPSGSVSETATTTLPAESASPVVPATDTLTLTPTQGLETPSGVTATSVTAASGTGTSNIPTATTGPANATASATSTLAAGQVTAVWTLAVRKYGTLPPAVPFNHITLINKANAEAYISLQVTMPDGTYSIIEYPVEGRIKIQAPVGSYLYVTWVGGRKMVGEFRLHNNEDLSITLYKDRVVIK
jgi:hypothetical protein